MTRLEQIVKRAKQLKKTAPASTKWTDLIKKASKQITPVRATASNKATATRNLGLSGVKKRATKSGSHKDTRSHNVNIRVMSGTTKKEAYIYLYDYGLEAYLINNYYIIKHAGNFVTTLHKISKISTVQTEIETDILAETKKRITDENSKLLKEWLTKLHKGLKTNPVKKAPTKKSVKKAPAKKSVKKASVKKAPVKKTRAQESEAIRQKVRKDGFIMPHGYAVRKAVREQSIGALSIDQLKKNTEAIERFTTKHIPYMLAEYKTAPAGQKAFIKKRILEAKKYVATLKKLNTGLKKHIK